MFSIHNLKGLFCALALPVFLAGIARAQPKLAALNQLSSDNYFVLLQQSLLNEDVSDEELFDFALSYEFVAALNEPFANNPLLAPIPQTLDVFAMLSWFKKEWVGGAVVTSSLMNLLMKSGLIGSLKPVLYWPSEELSLIYMPEAGLECGQFSLAHAKFSANDSIFLGNEYRNEGQLALGHLERAQPGLKEANVVFRQEPADQLGAFMTAAKGPGHSFAVFSAAQILQIKRKTNFCVAQTFVPDAAGYFLLLDEDLKIETHLLQRILKKAEQRAMTSKSQAFISYWQRQNDIISDRSDIKKRVKELEHHFASRPSLLTIDLENLKERIQRTTLRDPLSVPLMGGGARSPYTFAMGFQFMHEVVDPMGIGDRSILIGTSGGAASALLISLFSAETTLDQVRELSHEISGYVEPQLRSDVLAFVTRHPYMGLALAIFLLLYIVSALMVLFFSSVSISLKVRCTVAVLTLLACYFVPAFPVEYLIGVLLILGAFGVLTFALRRRKAWQLVLVCSLIVVIASIVKLPFHTNSIFDSFDMKSYIADVLKHSDQGTRKCVTLKEEGDISRCLYDWIRYPLVIVATDANFMAPVNFYVNPTHSRIVFPQEGNWVDLAQCPHNLIAAVQASSAIPLFFSPVELECANRRFLLVDGGLLSRLPLAQAEELGARSHFLLWNQPIDISHGFVTKNAPVSEWTIARQFAMLWVSKFVIATDVRSVDLAFSHRFFITQPSTELIRAIDFWGGRLPDGRFVLPLDLMGIAQRDFHDKRGEFSEISDGEVTLNAFYLRYEEKIKAALRVVMGAS